MPTASTGVFWRTAWALAAGAALVWDALSGKLARTAWTLLALAALNLALWVALVGGPTMMYEVLQVNFRPRLARPRPRPGQTALVTGATGGLGSSMAQALTELQLATVLCDLDGEELSRLSSRLRAEQQVLDLTSPASSARLAERLRGSGTKLDVLILAAGLCDASNVPVPGSSVARLFFVNFLGNVVLVSELLAKGLLRPGARILVVGSGSYVLGTSESFGGQDQWTALEAMEKYGQTKYLLTAWACWLREQLTPKGIDVVVANPGPMNSTMGEEHVPIPLWPSFKLMKEVLFPSPREAADALASFVLDHERFPSGSYMSNRALQPLLSSVLSPSVQERVLSRARELLAEAGYTWNMQVEASREK